jgi:hypothetical protein
MTPKEAILKYFCEMDIEMLRMVLNDLRTYQGAKKGVFLGKVEEVFEKFRKGGDSYLKKYNGKCGEHGCEKKGCPGIVFVGNVSRNYFELLFEVTSTGGLDIQSCPSFERDEIDVELGEKFSVHIGNDEMADFFPTNWYQKNLKNVERAMKELCKDDVAYLTKEDYVDWIEKYDGLYEEIFSPFDSFNGFEKFIWIHNWLKEYADYLKYEIGAKTALEEFGKINLMNESELLRWLVRYEDLGGKLIHVGIRIFNMEGGNVLGIYERVFKDYDIFIAVSDYMNLINFSICFNKYHMNMWKKYLIVSDEEFCESESTREEIEQHYSLKYNLMERGMIDEKGRVVMNEIDLK